MGIEDSDCLARLHEERLFISETLQRCDDGVVALPVARGLPRPP